MAEDPEKLRLIQQVKDLQQQLALAKLQHQQLVHQHSTINYIEPEFALGPSQIHSVGKKKWQEDESWSKEERSKYLHSLEYDPYMFENEDHKLLLLCYEMFDSLGLIKEFKIPTATLQHFLINLQASYRRIPFHNFFHSFNVAQTVYFFLTECKLGDHFQPIETFSLLLAALCHDIDHPGLNNTFLCNARTSLGLLYNDFSVLEQHHCHQAFELLRKPECNILVNLTDDQYSTVRKSIISCILSTDLSVHPTYMTQLKKLESVSWDSVEDKKLIMSVLIKCADISNEVRPPTIGRKWAQRVMAEFFAQSSLEKEKGLPIAPHMDPLKTNTASGQIGFITYLCLPLFSEIARLFPTLKICCNQMISNRNQWEEIQKNTEN